MDLQKTSFSTNDIYQILKNEITSLKLLPGQSISETEISKRFGVSRTPIRDVFKRLEYNQLVRIVPQKGTIVTPVDLGKISGFMFVREKVEIGVTEEIIQSISSSQLTQLQLILIQQRKLIENSTLDLLTKANGFFELDNQFHYTLFKIADKDSLWDIFTSNMPDYQRFRAISAELSTEADLAALYTQHTEILTGIQEKDLLRIKETFKKHINDGIGNLAFLLNKKENYFVV